MIDVILEAEEETGQVHRWQGQAKRDDPLQVLVDKWAQEMIRKDSDEFFGAGLEEPDREGLLNLKQTPEDLRWTGQKRRVLWVVPLDSQNAEGGQSKVPQVAPLDNQNAEAVHSKVKVAQVAALDSQNAEVDQCKVQKVVPMEPLPQQDGGRILATSIAETSPVKTSPAKSPAKPDESQRSARPDESQRPAKRVKTSAKVEVKASPVVLAPISAPAEKNEKVAAPAQKGEAKAASKANRGGAVPTGDDRIAFEQRNPKRQGTESFNRYEKYKGAKTPTEAMQLGACKGDLANDFQKGYMKSVS